MNPEKYFALWNVFFNFLRCLQNWNSTWEETCKEFVIMVDIYFPWQSNITTMNSKNFNQDFVLLESLLLAQSLIISTRGTNNNKTAAAITTQAKKKQDNLPSVHRMKQDEIQAWTSGVNGCCFWRCKSTENLQYIKVISKMNITILIFNRNIFIFRQL